MKALFPVVLLSAFAALANERMPVWPEGKMPDFQPQQIAAMTDVAGFPGKWKSEFNADEHRMPYLEWFDEQPASEKRNGICMILISGGGYACCCDVELLKMWRERFLSIGCVCVNFVYRTPRPEGLPMYQSAWEDAQRAVRLVRHEAKARGFDPEKIGVLGCSAGAHLATLLATSSQTPAYAPIDELDKTSCHIAFAITAAIPYGYVKERLPTHLGEEFKFDDKTAPMCMLQGGKDSFGCLHSSHVYRQLRRMKIPSELHYFADRTHGFWGANPDLEKGTGYDNWFENVRGFIRQMNFDGKLAAEEKIEPRFPDDSACGEHFRREVWPAGKMPDVQTNQCTPFLEWWIPKSLKTRSIQIVYSGGSYSDNHPEAWDGVPAVKRFLNQRGMTVVTLKYRTPRPTSGVEFYRTAWQDLQRAVRLVKEEAPWHGLDPNSVGIWGSSAGGHLTLLGALSSTIPAYEPIDALDAIPCNVRWAVAVYPAYVLTEGNKDGGNQDSSVPGPEFAFDARTCPVIFLHGDADGWTAMNSVKVWERLTEMGVQCDLHTLARRQHCFMMSASAGTGSFDWLNRVWEFMNHKGYNKTDEHVRMPVWPDGKMPDVQTNQTSAPFLVWHTPAELRSKAVLIAVSGGGYGGSSIEGFEVSPIRDHFLNKGVTVVTMRYRAPRPIGRKKHLSAWQDAQRTVRLVRREARRRGLDPDRIGFTGCSAGGHLTMMAATSSKTPAYSPVDELDKEPCNVNWAIPVYPAYLLSDAEDSQNPNRGNDLSIPLSSDFAFDDATPPMCFFHGDADGWTSMGSVRAYHRLRTMGIPAELHVMAREDHCFMAAPREGTPAAIWKDVAYAWAYGLGIISHPDPRASGWQGIVGFRNSPPRKEAFADYDEMKWPPLWQGGVRATTESPIWIRKTFVGDVTIDFEHRTAQTLPWSRYTVVRKGGGFTGLVNGESVSQERLSSLGVFAQFPFAERIGFAGCQGLTRPEIRNVRVRVE